MTESVSAEHGKPRRVVAALNGSYRQQDESSALHLIWHALRLAWPFLALGIGSALQSYANETLGAALAAVMFLVLGYGIVTMAFARDRFETRAFLLSYTACVLAGGLGQWYSVLTSGQVQSTTDAIGFLDAALPNPVYYSWHDLDTVTIGGYPVSRGAPLAVALWQWVFQAGSRIGLEPGLYLGVLFNALTMGLTASITVRIAREVFGDDPWRLRRVGTLFAWCGLFILFGAILLRDCFTTFLNVLVLWGIVRWIAKPSLRNALLAAVLTGLSVWAMYYLRSRVLVLFALYWVVAIACWIPLRTLNPTRLLVLAAGFVFLVVGSAWVANYIEHSRNLQSHNQEKYTAELADTSQEGSLAVAVLVKQPLPIRLVLGSVSRMVFPIPLWAYFGEGTSEYHLIKGYHGLYQVVVMPLVLLAFMCLPGLYRGDRKFATPLIYLAIYFIVNLEAVIATSLEQRHIAQFMPAALVLSALVDTRIRRVRTRLELMAFAWIMMVVAIHLVWLILK